MKHTPAFTLVELIVVIVILGILSTIGFVSYNGYLAGARDSNRISTLKGITDSLNLYASRNSFPFPQDYVTVTGSGITLGFQGYVGQSILEIVNYTSGGKDPKDDSYYSYYLSANRKNFQLLGYLEEAENLETASVLPLLSKEVSEAPLPLAGGDTEGVLKTFLPQTYAADYTNRFPKVYGKKLGILTLSSNKAPVQEITTGTLELTTTTENYTAYFTDQDTLTASGYTLHGLTQTRLGTPGPSDCPTGFIPVPGNPEFNTTGFCVAQYEMTYSDATVPDSCDTQHPAACTSLQDVNTLRYQVGKPIVSIAGKYPISNITQLQAINTCKSLGSDYHLITNNEWMTIVRNIEANPKNWSSGKVGQGNIYNGISGAGGTIGCAGNLGGNIDPRLSITKTGPGADALCNTRRSHALSNGQKVWDMSGNVTEHVNKANTIDGSGYDVSQTTLTGSSNPIDWDDNGIYSTSDMKKYGSAAGLGMTGGMGSVYYTQGVVNNIFLRGGPATFGTYAGVFGGVFIYTTSYQSRVLGFRCAR